jgi:hypothetical protein
MIGIIIMKSEVTGPMWCEIQCSTVICKMITIFITCQDQSRFCEKQQSQNHI